MNDCIKVKVNSYGPGRPLALVYRDPTTGKKVAKSAGTTDEREAERAAAVLEDELNTGRFQAQSNVTWADFRKRYEAEKLAGLSPKTRENGRTAFNHVERVLNPDKLRKLTPATLSRFQATLRQEGMRDTTLASVLRHLRPALTWAVSMGMLASVPKVHMPKQPKGQCMMRGRPVTGEEFDRMIAAVPKVRPDDAPAWIRYLTGLWLSGLRLEESLALSWDQDAPFCVDLTGRRPAFRIYAEAQKARRDSMLPMTPDFAEWLLATPEAERHGRVFRLAGLGTGGPVRPKRVCRIVSKIGRRAGVVVNKSEGKYASCHDLRRSFGTRWASRVRPAVLQRLMRHVDIQTTLRYYVSLDSDDVADELWAAWGPATARDRGNTLATIAPDGAGNGKGALADDSTETL